MEVFAERGFCSVAVQCWNALPHDIHIGSNLPEFDKLSKTYLLSQLVLVL